MKKLILVILILAFVDTLAQEKKIWAKSFINEKAPELVVEEWLSKIPQTKGKFILIDFWATWCEPCIKAIPELNGFQKEFQEDLVVIGISDESKKLVTKFKKAKIEYYSAIDTKKRMERILEVASIPHCIIIDPNGIVRWEGWPQLEGFELTSEVIQDILTTYK